ncbi:hypothetical protein KFY46_26480, partial [Salmonella enterica subsp. enterica serovar 1,4,[5],12:i:-]|nr:hypothetical protein [Salmonella enterica subsp. enterica serovar 1,4,[5],12:i:-]
GNPAKRKKTKLCPWLVGVVAPAKRRWDEVREEGGKDEQPTTSRMVAVGRPEEARRSLATEQWWCGRRGFNSGEVGGFHRGWRGS